MDPPQRLTRRSHTKSKRGCITCRRRHIRCDEGEPICRNCVRYGSSICYDRAESDATGSTSSATDAELEQEQDALWPTEVVSELNAWIKDQSMTDAASAQITTTTLLATFIPDNEDTRTMYFMANLAARLVHEQNSQMLAFGTMVLPQFLEQAAAHRFVRDAVMALSASHLSTLSKQTGLDAQMAKYRALASSGLGRALNNFSKENADALLTGSIVLAWNSPDDNAFAQYLSGIITLVQQMWPWRHESRLTSLLRPDAPLPTNDKRLMVAYLSASEDDLNQMKPLLKGLTDLLPRLGNGSETLEATHELINFVHNTRLVSDQQPTFEQQARVLRPISNWIPYCPRAPKGLESRDLHILTIMAYFHALAIASETYLPDATRAMFLPKRAEVIGNIWTELLRLESSEEVDEEQRSQIAETLDMIVMPLVYAVRYRLKNVTSGE